MLYAFSDTGALNRPGISQWRNRRNRWRKNVATLTGGTGSNTPNRNDRGGYLEATPIISGSSIQNTVVPGTLANVLVAIT